LDPLRKVLCFKTAVIDASALDETGQSSRKQMEDRISKAMARIKKDWGIK
jgi:hypothetical protein